MDKTFSSWDEVERTYFPNNYALSLAKSGEVNELVNYILDKKIDYINLIELGLLQQLGDSKNVGKFLSKISIENMRRIIEN